ncbi:MAG: hypothetical protein DWQ34_07635 [Planctomycetota bacterium]|nr:MAG: hypothetical protein DWQ29_09420 [Planctomycetota bacterium]REJ94868.1 MAG: hypothetical protein DWQ34_07635 [Planctomycetota bacterium]REK30730.1 MAG: hypothetical protein DWQ41_01920 [Planctomycetota bacterium]REK33105.1 MAG: hypothetical protein DWQ45_16025 [Planctomycetota bacterium]
MNVELDENVVHSRLARCFELHEVGRELALTGLRMRFPKATEEEIWQKLREQVSLRRRGKWGIE